MRKITDRIADVCKEKRRLVDRFNLLSMGCEHIVDTLVNADHTITYICNKVGKLCEIDNCPLEISPKTGLKRILGRIGG